METVVLLSLIYVLLQQIISIAVSTSSCSELEKLLLRYVHNPGTLNEFFDTVYV